MSRIWGLKEWTHRVVHVRPETKSDPGLVKAIKSLIVTDEDQDAVLALAKKMAPKGSRVVFNPKGFTISSALPNPVPKTVGSSQPSVFPVTQVPSEDETYPDRSFPFEIGWKRGDRENKKRFSETDQNDRDATIGVYVPYAAKKHPDLFRKHMVKLRATRDGE
jgi:hypothetical protein